MSGVGECREGCFGDVPAGVVAVGAVFDECFAASLQGSGADAEAAGCFAEREHGWGDRGDMGVSFGGDVSGVTGDMGSSVCHPLVVAVMGALSARVGWVR